MKFSMLIAELALVISTFNRDSKRWVEFKVTLNMSSEHTITELVSFHKPFNLYILVPLVCLIIQEMLNKEVSKMPMLMARIMRDCGMEACKR
jgi:hypothetical protein